MSALPEPTTYKVIRFRCDAPNVVVRTGLTREEAEAHCCDESTHGEGWFDGWEVENPSDDELAARAASDANLLSAVVAVEALVNGRRDE